MTGTPDGRWIEVGDGVLARRHTELDLTTGLVLGAERALVVDTRGDARQGAELAEAVRAVTALPLTVVVTHAHFDHCFGTAAFLPCPVFAHPRCRDALAATAGAQRAEWATYYRDRGDPGTAAALAATDPPLPDHRVDREVPLDLGGRTVAPAAPRPRPHRSRRGRARPGRRGRVRRRPRRAGRTPGPRRRRRGGLARHPRRAARAAAGRRRPGPRRPGGPGVRRRASAPSSPRSPRCTPPSRRVGSTRPPPHDARPTPTCGGPPRTGVGDEIRRSGPPARQPAGRGFCALTCPARPPSSAAVGARGSASSVGPIALTGTDRQQPS